MKIAHSDAIVNKHCKRDFTFTKSNMQDSVSLPNVLKFTGTCLMTRRLSHFTTSGLIKLRWEPVSKKARTFACWLQ